MYRYISLSALIIYAGASCANMAAREDVSDGEEMAAPQAVPIIMRDQVLPDELVRHIAHLGADDEVAALNKGMQREVLQQVHEELPLEPEVLRKSAAYRQMAQDIEDDQPFSFNTPKEYKRQVFLDLLADGVFGEPFDFGSKNLEHKRLYNIWLENEARHGNQHAKYVVEEDQYWKSQPSARAFGPYEEEIAGRRIALALEVLHNTSARGMQLHSSEIDDWDQVLRNISSNRLKEMADEGNFLAQNVIAASVRGGSGAFRVEDLIPYAIAGNTQSQYALKLRGYGPEKLQEVLRDVHAKGNPNIELVEGNYKIKGKTAELKPSQEEYSTALSANTKPEILELAYQGNIAAQDKVLRSLLQIGAARKNENHGFSGSIREVLDILRDPKAPVAFREQIKDLMMNRIMIQGVGREADLYTLGAIARIDTGAGATTHQQAPSATSSSAGIPPAGAVPSTAN